MPESNTTYSKGIGDYNRTLCFCFLSSLAVCLAFLPVVPLDQKMGRSASDITFSVSKLLLTVLIIYAFIAVVHLIWRQKKYHQTQVVFWPTRCQHCASVLKTKQRTIAPSPGTSHNHLEQSSGLIRDSQTSPRDNLPLAGPTRHSGRSAEQQPILQTNEYTLRDKITSPSCFVSYFVDSEPRARTNYGSVLCSEGATTAPPNVQNISPDQAINDTSMAHACTRRNRSLVNAFIVFSLISLIAIPFEIVADIICIIQSDRPIFTIIIQEAEYIALFAMFPIAMKFAWNYYDAVFVTTRPNACFVIVSLSLAIWISSIKLIDPISSVLQWPFDKPGSLCNLTGKFGQFFSQAETVATPCYTECAFIAAGIFWEVWTSLIPACPSGASIQVTEDFIAYPASSEPPSLLSRAISCLKSRVKHVANRSEEARLMGQYHLGGTGKDLEACLWKTWILSAVQSLVFFATSFYFVKISEADRNSYDIYIAWSIEILFVFPFLILYMHLSYVTNKMPPASDVPSPDHCSPYLLLKKTKTEAHDVLLLVCSCGIFCLCFFQTASAVGLLLCSDQVDQGDNVAQYIFAIAHSVFIVPTIWYMTTFLLRVQKQLRRVRDPLEMKWTMVLLVNIMVTNGMQWLIESVARVESPLTRKFFAGQTGDVMSIVLNPFTTLYGLHAAMIAYEAYRVIFKKAFSDPQGSFDPTLINTDR